MEVSKVSQEDGKCCAALAELLTFSTKLLDALKIAGISLSGPGISMRDEVKQWVNQLAMRMAMEIRKQEEASKSMSVKSVGQPQKLSSVSKKKSSKKK